MTNSFFEPPFGGVRGNVRTSSIARWKAHSRLPIRDYWTFFASSCGSDVISRYWSKLAFLKGGGWITLSANFRWKGTSPTNLLWFQKTRVITLSCGIKISAVCSFVSSQSTRMTDRQTVSLTQDLNSIVASRCKNNSDIKYFLLNVRQCSIFSVAVRICSCSSYLLSFIDIFA